MQIGLVGSKVAAPIRLILVGILFVAIGWLLLDFLHGLGGPSTIRARFGNASILIIFAMFLTPLLPSEIASLVAVAIYGFEIGVALIWIGLLARAGGEYTLGRLLVTPLAKSDATIRLPGWFQRFPANHLVFLVVARWLPAGNHVVSTAAGLQRVPLRRFIWTAAVALAPPALLVGAGAAGLVSFHG